MAIASMVCGIVGILSDNLFGVGCVLGIIAVFLSVKSTNASEAAGAPKSGMAIAGLVCGIIAIVFGASCLLCTVCSGGLGCLGALVS